MSENYRMVGIVNVFGVIPDFVLPVFEKPFSDKLYVQMGESETVTEMLEIGEDLAQRVYFYDDVNPFREVNITDEYRQPFYCFQTENGVFIGNAMDVFEFFEVYHFNSKRVKEEIKQFRKDNPHSYRMYLASRRKRKITKNVYCDDKRERPQKVVKVIPPRQSSITIHMKRKKSKKKLFVLLLKTPSVRVPIPNRKRVACRVQKIPRFKKNKKASTD